MNDRESIIASQALKALDGKKCDKLASLTDYPNLFENTYWGNFLYRENMTDIILNRNSFVKEFQEIVFCKKWPEYVKYIVDRNVYKYVDHSEIYKYGDSYLILISPYNHVDPSKIINDNWTLYSHNLYNEDAITFYRIVNKTNSKNIKNQYFEDRMNL